MKFNMTSEPITIRLKVGGLDCWHRVLVRKTKLPLLARLEAGEAIDVKSLGEVLESGWGAPPAEVIDYETIDA